MSHTRDSTKPYGIILMQIQKSSSWTYSEHAGAKVCDLVDRGQAELQSPLAPSTRTLELWTTDTSTSEDLEHDGKYIM